MTASVGVVRFLDGPLLMNGADAVAEPTVDGALGGEEGGQGLPARVDAVDLVTHHLGHDAAPRMGGLDLDVGHAGHDGGAAGDGHLQPVRVRPGDDLAVLKHGNGAAKIEVGPQFLRVVVQAVAVGARLGAHPGLELVGGDVSQFQHRAQSLPPVEERATTAPSLSERRSSAVSRSYWL